MGSEMCIRDSSGTSFKWLVFRRPDRPPTAFFSEESVDGDIDPVEDGSVGLSPVDKPRTSVVTRVEIGFCSLIEFLLNGISF